MSPYDHWKTTDRLSEAPDPLEGKPRGYCPWCGSRFAVFPNDEGTQYIACYCPDYHDEDTEDENRIRYAASKLEESKLWNKIENEGGENA